MNAVIAACERIDNRKTRRSSSSSSSSSISSSSSDGGGGNGDDGETTMGATTAVATAGMDATSVAVAVLEAAMARPGGLDMRSVAVSARLRTKLPITWPVQTTFMLLNGVTTLVDDTDDNDDDDDKYNNDDNDNDDNEEADGS